MIVTLEALWAQWTGLDTCWPKCLIKQVSLSLA